MRTHRRESLHQRLRLIRSGRASASGLEGCPVGGWPETQQGMRSIREDIPVRAARTYTIHQLVDAIYTVDASGRYRRMEAV